jgi:SSS family solute:Na+ symporter
MDSHASLAFIEWVVLVVYLAATFGISIWTSRRQATENEYFMASRNATPLVAAVSLFATLFSTSTFVAAPSEGYRHGLTMWLGSVGYALFTPLAVYLFLAFFYGRGDNCTLYQYLEQRFDWRARTLAAAAFLIGRTLSAATACYAGAKLFDAMAGWDARWTIVTMVLFTTCYTALGGMRGVLLTDFMQTVVMLLGVMVIWGCLSSLVGHDYAAVWSYASEHGRAFNDVATPEFYRFDLNDRLSIWTLLLIYSILRPLQDYGTDQMVVQRLLSAGSLADAKRAVYIKTAMAVPVMAIFYGLGILLFYYYNHVVEAPQGLEPDKILPHFVTTTLPAPLPGLLAAAMLAALMSTISSILSSLATVSSIDFLQRWGIEPVTEGRKVALGRLLTLAWGVVVLAGSLAMLSMGRTIEDSIMEVSQVILSLWGVLLVVVLAGVRTSWATSNAATAALVAGMAVGVFVPYRFYVMVPADERISFLWLGVPGIVVTAVILVLVSLWERSRRTGVA